MEEIKETIECSNCNEKNVKGTHYCKNCGKNLSDIIEKTDAFFFISGLMKWIGIILGIEVTNLLLVNYILNMFRIELIRYNPLSGKLFFISMIYFGIATIFLILSFFSKKHSLHFKERGIFLAILGFVCFVIDNLIVTVVLFEHGIFDKIFVACIIQYIVAAILFILSVRLKKHTLKLCKQNLQVK